MRKLTKPGLYPDGKGLYLQVRGPGARSWLYRYMRLGKARVMGRGEHLRATITLGRSDGLRLWFGYKPIPDLSESPSAPGVQLSVSIDGEAVARISDFFGGRPVICTRLVGSAP